MIAAVPVVSDMIGPSIERIFRLSLGNFYVSLELVMTTETSLIDYIYHIIHQIQHYVYPIHSKK